MIELKGLGTLTDTALDPAHIGGIANNERNILKDYDGIYTTIRTGLCLISDINRTTLKIKAKPHLKVLFDTPEGTSDIMIPVDNAPNVNIITDTFHDLVMDMFEKSNEIDWTELASRGVNSLRYDQKRNAVAELKREGTMIYEH